MGADGSKALPKNIEEIPTSALEEVVVTTMDALAQETGGEPTALGVVSKMKTMLKSMNIEGDIETRRAEIEKLVNELLDGE